MKIRTIFATVALLSAALNAPAQQTRMLTADKHNEYGLVYRLPVTALRIDVTARHTVEKAGPYYQYAKKFIGTDNVIKADAEKWEITSVKVTPYGVPDNEGECLMQVKPGSLTSVCVAGDGMLLGINTGAESPVLPVVPEEGVLEQGNVRAYLQYVDEDFLASQSGMKQAQTLAENIMEVRDAKISLTRGTAETMPSDGRQLELMLNSLGAQEAAMTAAFTGLRTNAEVTRSFTLVPGQEGKQVLFRMSDFGGFRDTDDYSGVPVYADVKVTRRGKLPVDAKGEEKKLPKDAVLYNLPGAAQVTLTCDGKTLWSGELEFAQYGMRFGLQPGLFSDKKSRSWATFDPATGALEELGTVE